VSFVNLDNRVVRACMAGVNAEFERRLDDARRLYAEAWDLAADDYERCIASHYVAHLEDDPAKALRWNLLALESAERADQSLVTEFLPSLYVNLGHSCELTGQEELATRYYGAAADLGLVHVPFE
jgi:hypothetical protein